MNSWGELVEAVKLALRTGDLANADSLVHRMSEVAGASGRLDLEASAAFHEGVVADKLGDRDRAETAFRQALAIDRRLHGDDHVAVADAARSLGMVQRAAGRLEAALASFEEAARIYALVESDVLTETMHSIGALLLRLARHADAETVYENAVLAAGALAMNHPLQRKVRVGHAWSLIHQERYPEALGILATASRLPFRDDVESFAARATVWLVLGHTSLVFDLEFQATACYACVLELTPDPTQKAEAEEGIDAIGTSFDGPIDVFRVVHVHPPSGRAHVMHVDEGFYLATNAGDAKLGAIVDIEPLEDDTDSPFVRLVLPATD